MTPAESALWECLRSKNLGVRFRRQHPVFGYIPDFVCLEKQLIVEVDGGYHFIGDQQVSDEERTRYLNQYGFEVIRFTNDEILNNIDGVINQIKDAIMSKENIKSTTPAGTPLLGRGRGRLIIFSAPSGSGKSTIVQWLMKEHPELNLFFSISCTSRPPRGTEQNGVEYFFLSPEEFKAKIEQNAFLEYEEVYENRFYGTLKSQVEKQLDAGQNVVFDVDVKGGINIKNHYGNQALSIFIQPPSIEELRKRLEGRATDSKDAIETRLAKAEYELSFSDQFDKIVINDDLDEAKEKTFNLVSSFVNS
jgi:guanylate kinase